MEILIIKASSQIEIPKITWTLILELIMKKPMIWIHISLLIFRKIPQFKLSHEHKKRQQFSVCKPEEEKQMLRSQSETQKYYFFVNPIIIHLPIKKKIKYYNMKRKKKRRFWSDPATMTSTCSSYQPICSPQKNQNIL